MKFLFSFLLFFAASTIYSQNIKLKIAGITDAAGEDITAFEVADTSNVSAVGGGGSVARFSDVKIKKLRGTSTNELFKRSINGLNSAEASFEFYDASAIMYYKIVLKEVFVSHFSYLSPECANCSKLFHQVWFEYRKIE
jgi:type VI protein secretion system component Hcp